jgi:imidazolonepropionase
LGVRLSTILIQGARQLVTLRGPKAPRCGPCADELHPITDGAVLIRDGVVAEVGPTRRLENLAQSREALVIEAAGRVVMPGFIDSHTHLAFPGPSGEEEEAARLVRASTGQRIEAKARAYVEAMARHGTTTVEAKTGCSDESAESKLLRVLASLRGDPLDLFPTFLCRFPEREPGAVADHIIEDLLPKVHKRKVAIFADLACTADGRALPHYERYLSAARDLGFACKVHADHAEPGPAVSLALAYAATSIDHLEHVSEADIRRLGAAGMVTTLTPSASFRDRGANAPARSLIDAGAAVAIATDFNPQHSPALNMQTAIALACLHMGMTIGEAITAATINGAHALGCAAVTGSIEPGKRADIVILNVADYRDLRYNLGTNAVHLTIKSGKVIYQEADVGIRADREVRLSY